MTVHDLPGDWLRPGSAGLFMLTEGRAAQVLLLIPCAGCNLPTAKQPTGCVNCAGSLAPGYLTMRCPLNELFAALRERARAKQLRPPSPEQRLFAGALGRFESKLVVDGECPHCGGELESIPAFMLTDTKMRCKGTCGRVYFILVDEEPALVVQVCDTDPGTPDDSEL